ncbi:MAG: dicarboxylate/amino acid:cation symporter [Clostridia bacterium]|nr:dicarboxylate/amino acid:cation symporter [Candidatus Pelethousia sp.]NCB30331.1 dicarboxylate/amino acid:cation symporter [Clostridia bacterium]
MESKPKKKLSLAAWIGIAMLAGIATGLLFLGNPDFTTTYIKPFGDIFINLLKFIVVPIVLLSMVSGMLSMKDIRRVGSIGLKTIIYFMLTTAVAIVIGLIFANLFKGSFTVLDTAGVEYEAKTANVMDTIVGIFPSNFWAPLVNASMLQVIVIALLLGAGILVTGEKGQPFARLITSANDVFMSVMMFIIKLSPIGVFCLMTWVVANQGPAILGSLALVLGVAYISYILHAVLVYSITVKVFSGMSPLKFFKGIIPAMAMAFSSTSSVATLPLSKECCDELGADSSISSFVLPLGATVNMDGTAIYMGVCSIFIATCYGINLTLGQMVTIVLTATIASIGTAGVSGAGMIMLAMVLTSVGLPVEGIGLIYGIDRLFDMGRTTLNVVGDCACSVIVTSMEQKKAATKTHAA